MRFHQAMLNPVDVSLVQVWGGAKQEAVSFLAEGEVLPLMLAEIVLNGLL